MIKTTFLFQYGIHFLIILFIALNCIFSFAINFKTIDKNIEIELLDKLKELKHFKYIENIKMSSIKASIRLSLFDFLIFFFINISYYKDLVKLLSSNCLIMLFFLLSFAIKELIIRKIFVPHMLIKINQEQEKNNELYN